MNFSTAMSDANYSSGGACSVKGNTNTYVNMITFGSYTTTYGNYVASGCAVWASYGGGSAGSATQLDPEMVSLWVFR